LASLDSAKSGIEFTSLSRCSLLIKELNLFIYAIVAGK